MKRLSGTLIVGGALVALGYAARLRRAEAQLAKVDAQLRDLYGPLYALSQASHATWQAFRTQCRPDKPFFSDAHPPTKAELAEWQRWMRTVFGPMNEQMVAVIIANSHLIEGRSMPACFLALIAHVEAYRVVLNAWDAGDAARYNAIVGFPEHFNEEVEGVFNALKARQGALIDARDADALPT